MNPLSFDRIKYYIACIKELQLQLDEFGKDFTKKDGQLIELVLMNLKIPYDSFFSSFWDNWVSCKKHGKDFTFDTFLFVDQGPTKFS